MIALLLALTFSASAAKLDRTEPVYGLTWALSAEHCTSGHWYQTYVRSYWISTTGRRTLALLLADKATAPVSSAVHDTLGVQGAMAKANCAFTHRDDGSGVLAAICPGLAPAVTLIQVHKDTSDTPVPGDWIMLGLSVPTRKATPGECD